MEMKSRKPISSQAAEVVNLGQKAVMLAKNNQPEETTAKQIYMQLQPLQPVTN